MDHDTCSAHLGPYSRGELDGDDRRLVEAHLAGCAECARELVAVRALMGLEDVQLTPDERRALHRAVLEPRRSRWARLAPALGAAGLLVTVAFGVTYLTGDGDGPLPAAVEQAPETARLEAGASSRVQDRDAGGTGGQAGAADAVQPATEAPGTDGAAGNATTLEAQALGIVTRFANAPLGPQLLAYDDAFASPEKTLRRLSRSVADRDAAAQISECAALVQNSSVFRLRPAFASVYVPDRLLVMGFVFTSGTEQRYAFWGWRLGDCTRPTPIYVTGPLQ